MTPRRSRLGIYKFLPKNQISLMKSMKRIVWFVVLHVVHIVSVQTCPKDSYADFFHAEPARMRGVVFPTLVLMDSVAKEIDTKAYVDRPLKKNYTDFEKDFNVLIDKLDSQDSAQNLRGIIKSAQDPKNIYYSPYLLVKSLERIFEFFFTVPESRELMTQFMQHNFSNVGDDLEAGDFKSDQTDNLSRSVKNTGLKNIAQSIEENWKDLVKKASKSKNFNYTSLINTNFDFFVPGGRFRESYYWDNFWVLKGLLSCDEYGMAWKIIENNITLINLYNYIPNGSRLYYLGRSQPPMFISMCQEYCHKLGFDKVCIEDQQKMFDAMVKEYEWWMSNRVVQIEFNDEKFVANVYGSNEDYPRLESYKEDINTFEELLHTKVKKHDLTPYEILHFFEENRYLLEDEKNLYSNIRASAESGWDFSSRFLLDSQKLYTNVTKDIVPVDLNTIMYHNEVVISEFASRLRQKKDSVEKYREVARKRRRMIERVLWAGSCWFDWNFVRKSSCSNGNFYFSNLMPLFYLNVPLNIQNAVLMKYSNQLRQYKFGIPASDKETQQQWDFPMIWAPHQDWMVDYYFNNKRKEEALDLARRFILAVQGRNDPENPKYVFYENYSCISTNYLEKKGEYKTQIGFGWTNGFIACILKKFGDDLVFCDETAAQTKAVEIHPAISIDNRHNEPILISHKVQSKM